MGFSVFSVITVTVTLNRSAWYTTTISKGWWWGLVGEKKKKSIAKLRCSFYAGMFRRLKPRPSCRARKKSRWSSLAVFSRGRTSGKGGSISRSHGSGCCASRIKRDVTKYGAGPSGHAASVERRWLTTWTRAQRSQPGELRFEVAVRPPIAFYSTQNTVFLLCGIRPSEPLGLTERALCCSCSRVVFGWLVSGKVNCPINFRLNSINSGSCFCVTAVVATVPILRRLLAF